MKIYRAHLPFSTYIRYFPMRKIRLWIIASFLMAAGMFLLFMSRSMESLREQQRIDSFKQKLPWDTLKHYHIHNDRKSNNARKVLPVPYVSKVGEKARPLAPPVLVKPNNVVEFRQQILPPNFNSFKNTSKIDHQNQLKELHQFHKLDKKKEINNVQYKNIMKKPKTMVLKERFKNNQNQFVFRASNAKMPAKKKQIVYFPVAKFSGRASNIAIGLNNKIPKLNANLNHVQNARLHTSKINVLHAPTIRRHAINGKFVRYSNSRFNGMKGDVEQIGKANIAHALNAAGIPNGRVPNVLNARPVPHPNPRSGNIQNARISERKVVLNNLAKTGTIHASKSGLTILKREGNSWTNADYLCQNASLKLETIAVPTPLGNVHIHGSKTETFESESAVENFESRTLAGFQKLLLDKSNSLVIDVGSGYGVYTIMAARMGHLVVAVEPNLSAIPGLCATIKLANHSHGVIIAHTKFQSNIKRSEMNSQVCSNYLDLDALTEINSLHSHEDAVIRISPRINNAEEITLCLNKLVVLFNIKAISMPWTKTSRRDAEIILKLFGRLKMSPHKPDAQQEILRSSDMSQWPSIVIWKSD